MSLVHFQTAGRAGGTESLPSGVVGLWPSTSSVPSGWVKCDGSNGTVDMRGYYARSTPDGGTINCTYGSASHTHAAPHSHVGTVDNHAHSIDQHCHTLDSHTHYVAAHCHTIDAHSHSLYNHTHTLPSHMHLAGAHEHSVYHMHDITDHCHSAGTLETPQVYHAVLNYGYAIGYSVAKCCAVTNLNAYPHAPQSLTGYTGTIFNAGICTSYESPGTDSVASPTDSCTPAVSSNGVGTSGDASPNTASDGTFDTGACQPDTDDAGAITTVSSGALATANTCAVVTGTGSTIPPTRNVEYIMKL